MNPERAIFGILVFFVPTGAVLFGLVAMGVIHFRRPKEPPDENPEQDSSRDDKKR